jgi:hypothetical protein
MISWPGLIAQLTVIVLAVLLAPILLGWVNQCRAWLQNKSGPASCSRTAPEKAVCQGSGARAQRVASVPRHALLLFACMCLAAGIVPRSAPICRFLRCRRHRPGGHLRPGAGIHRARRHGHRHRIPVRSARGGR